MATTAYAEPFVGMFRVGGGVFSRQTGIGIVKIRRPDEVEDGLDVYTEIYMHRVLWCLEGFAPKLLLGLFIIGISNPLPSQD